MSTRIVAATLAVIALLDATSKAAAQDNRPLPAAPAVEMPRPGPGDRPIEVSVQYSFMLPTKSDNQAIQRDTLENGRRMVYEIAAEECKVLLATIATSCELARINVNSSQQRHNPTQEMVTVGANAAYKIVIKPRR